MAVKATGMGLGLPIAQYWTERMGGQLSITSDGCGLGTRVALVIPFDMAFCKAPRPSAPATPMYRVVGSCSEAVVQQLQWLGCVEWDGEPPGADAPPVLTVQEVTRGSPRQYDSPIPTTFVDIGTDPEPARPDHVESWRYVVRPVTPSSLLPLLGAGTSRRQESWRDAELRVLAVDDIAVNRRLIGIHLEGWTVDEAENGLQAVDMARKVIIVACAPWNVLSLP